MAIIVSALLVYWPAVELTWIWDDDQYVTNNPLLRDINGLGSIWFEPAKSPQYYPLVFSALWIQFQAFGLDPTGYHVANVLLHACNGVICYFVLKNLSLKYHFWIAIAFTLHPIQVESVAWITEIKNLLSATFFGLAWLTLWPLLAAKSREKNARTNTGATPRKTEKWASSDYTKYGIGTTFFLLALLSKSVTASLPAAMLVGYWFKEGRLPLHVIRRLIPLLLVGALFGWNTARLEQMHVGASGAEWNWGIADRFGIAARSIVHYIANSVMPLEQVFFYPRFEVGLSEWQNVASLLLGVAILLLLLFLVTAGTRGPLAAMAFFVGTALPSLGFLNVYPHRFSFVADHFIYIPLIGLLCLWWTGLGWGVEVLWKRMPTSVAKLSWVPMVVVLACYSAKVTEHLPVFANSTTLWEDTVKKNPACPAALQNLGLEYFYADRIAEAEQTLLRALQFDFDRYQTQNSLGLVYQKQGKNERAIEAFQKSFALNPTSPRPLVNAANLLRSTGEEPLDASVREQVIGLYRQAWQAQPNYLAAFGLGTSYYEAEQKSKAADWFLKAAKLVGGDLDANYNYVLCLYESNQLQAASEESIKLLTDFPNEISVQELCQKVEAANTDAPIDPKL